MDEDKKFRPGQFNINPNLVGTNNVDADGNPTGGSVSMKVPVEAGYQANCLQVLWQDGPRGTNANGELAEPNGAFVEDVMWVALQRLEFFQDSKYKSEANQVAIHHIAAAIESLNQRSKERAERGVLGKHEV